MLIIGCEYHPSVQQIAWVDTETGECRRQNLPQMLDRINPTITELTQSSEDEAEKCPEAQRLMTHPGVGALTALAFVQIIGEADRFGCGKQIASYVGLVPTEDSSGEQRRLGHISNRAIPCSAFCWWKRRR